MLMPASRYGCLPSPPLIVCGEASMAQSLCHFLSTLLSALQPLVLSVATFGLASMVWAQPEDSAFPLYAVLPLFSCPCFWFLSELMTTAQEMTSDFQVNDAL